MTNIVDYNETLRKVRALILHMNRT